jgi:hypothetical protein
MLTMKTALMLFGVFSVSALFAEKYEFERYQPILDRQMFGAVPAGFDPTVLPKNAVKTEERELTKEQEQLQSSIHFSVINITPDGSVAVGFTDNSDSKNPVHYYLKVGERRNGWEVKEADPLKATMTIAKGEVEVSLTIGDNSAKSKGATTRAGALAENSPGGTLRSLHRPRFGGGTGGSANPLGMSLRERRAAREQERQVAEAAAREKAEQERAQREADREAQRQELQAIRDELKAQREAAELEKAQREAERAAAKDGTANGGEENANN